MTRRPRRAVLLAIILAAAAALTACAGLPTDGPVNAGLAVDADAPPDVVSFLPDKPQEGASPQQIVEGFIRAGSGPTSNWETARLYLDPSLREQWRPEAGVTIDVLSDRQPTVTSETTMDVQLTQVATVDDTGVYSVVERGPTTLQFTLAQDEAAQWRITEAPDGIVLDEDQFDSVFNAYPLAYFDPDWQYLVPDVRWFPTSNAATRIALALVDGAPSAWLAGSVVTAFPENVSLQGPAVPVENGVADVALGGSALALDAVTRSRMLTQLQASLSPARVSAVTLTASGTELDASAAPVRSTNVSPQALGVTEQGFGFLSGGDIQPIDGLTEAMATVQPGPVAIQLATDRQFAAALVASGEVVRVQADGQVILVDATPNLVDPSLDPQGNIWSAPAEAPTQLTAYSAQGERIDVQNAWVGASRITAMAVSRDGARVAAIVTVSGNSVVTVAGIVRDDEGVPRQLGDWIPLGTVAGAGLDIGWLDNTTVGVLSRAGDTVELVQQPVGGPAAEPLTAPPGTTSLAGATIPSGVRLRDAEGALYIRRGSNWQQTGTGVLVLGVQSGPG